MGATQIQVVLDLSNRPGCFSDLVLKDEFVNDMSAEMVSHFFESLASAARVTMHLIAGSESPPESSIDAVIAASGAIGAAFKACSRVDPRLRGTAASSKGTLSV